MRFVDPTIASLLEYLKNFLYSHCFFQHSGEGLTLHHYTNAPNSTLLYTVFKIYEYHLSCFKEAWVMTPNVFYFSIYVSSCNLNILLPLAPTSNDLF